MDTSAAEKDSFYEEFGTRNDQAATLGDIGTLWGYLVDNGKEHGNYEL